MKKILLAAAIITIAFTACKKSTTEDPTPTTAPTMVGLWKGKINNVTPQALNLKADNTLILYNNLDTAATLANGRGTGTYTKNNNLVNISYKYNTQPNVTYTLNLTTNDALNSMSGNIYETGSLFGTVQLNK
jgi:hypothetical protein